MKDRDNGGGFRPPVEHGQWMFGATGVSGRDGILSPEQIVVLNGLQQGAAAKIESHLESMGEGDKFPMVAMATGIGKGNIIHRITEQQMRKKPDSKVLIIAGTKNILVSQTHSALARYQETTEGTSFSEAESLDVISQETTDTDDEEALLSENKSNLYRTGKYGDSTTNVHVATIQKVQAEVRKGKINPDEYDLVIVDEVHNIGTPRRFNTIKKFKKVVGLTATPHRHSGKMKTPEDYGFEIVESLSLPEAQNLGLLPPLCGVQINTAGILDEIPTNYMGRIDYKKLERMLARSTELRPEIVNRILPIITSEGNNYKTVIAVNFVWEAREIAELLSAHGVKVGVAVNEQASKQIHTEEIPAIGAADRYKLPHEDPNSLQVLVSPYVASEGFDAPFTEVLVWASPTDSSLRYTQYTGRLARRAPGKLFGVVIDCLYQTDQYKWAYNFGMWMKDDVVQLDNGLLWLGREVDIETIKGLPIMDAIIQNADAKPLKDLQKEMGLEEVQPGEFSVVKANLLDTFRGGVARVMAAASDSVAAIREENPDLVITRRSHTHPVDVVDKTRLIEEMEKRGVKVKDPDIKKADKEVQTEHIIITEVDLKDVFVGTGKRLEKIADAVVAELRESNPDIVDTIQRGKWLVTVVKDKQRFIEEMAKQGVIEKDPTVEPVKVGEFIISVPSMLKTFVGGPQKLARVGREVLADIAERHPELVVTRYHETGRIYVTVVTDEVLFMEEMLSRGVNIR